MRRAGDGNPDYSCTRSCRWCWYRGSYSRPCWAADTRLCLRAKHTKRQPTKHHRMKRHCMKNQRMKIQPTKQHRMKRQWMKGQQMKHQQMKHQCMKRQQMKCQRMKRQRTQNAIKMNCQSIGVCLMSMKYRKNGILTTCGCHYDDVSTAWNVIKTECQQYGMSSRRNVIKTECHQDGMSSRWNVIKTECH